MRGANHVVPQLTEFVSIMEIEMEADELFRTIRRLVEAWCDRRNLKALRYVLRGYQLGNTLTDGWTDLMVSLQDVRAFAREEITPEELNTVNECVSALEKYLYRD